MAAFDEDTSYLVTGGWTETDPYGNPSSYPAQCLRARRIIEKRWNNTPNYRELREKRQRLPTQSFFYKKTHQGGWSGKMKSYGASNPNYYFEMGGVLNDVYPGQYLHEALILPLRDEVLQANLRDEATNKLLNKVKESDVNVAQAFGERRQTIDLIEQNVKRIADAIRYLKRGNLPRAGLALGVSTDAARRKRFERKHRRSPSKAVASEWLALQYGWLPLLSDIHGALQLIERQLDPFREDPIRVSSKASRKFESIVDQVGGISGCLVTKQTLRYHYNTKVSVEYVRRDPVSHDLASVGVLDPVLLAWELLPFSFVVDWFIPVGNYLSAFNATIGLKFLRGTIATKYRVDNESTAYGRANGSHVYVGDVAAKGSYMHLERNALTGWPEPKFPSFKDPFSATHVANAIALVTTIFGGPSGSRPRFR